MADDGYIALLVQHGSDSSVYDTEGRFRPQQFEDMFAKYDKEGDGTLTLRQLFDLMSGNRNAMDPFGVRSPPDAHQSLLAQ